MSSLNSTILDFFPKPTILKKYVQSPFSRKESNMDKNNACMEIGFLGHLFVYCLPIATLVSARLLYESVYTASYLVYRLFFGHTTILCVILLAWITCIASNYYGVITSKFIRAAQGGKFFDIVFYLNIGGTFTIVIEIATFLFVAIIIPLMETGIENNDVIEFVVLFVSPLFLLFVSLLNILFLIGKNRLLSISLVAGFLYSICSIMLSLSFHLVLNKV